MAHTEHSSQPNNPEIQYEKTDAGVRPLYWFLVWITVLTVVTAVLSWYGFVKLKDWNGRSGEAAAMADTSSNRQPPEPRLQTREPLDYDAYKSVETEKLTSYGIVDRDTGVFHIPIDEAMRLVVERGLPSSAPAGDASPQQVTAPQPRGAAHAPAPAQPAEHHQ